MFLSNRNRGGNGRMWVISNNLEILETVVEDRRFFVQFQTRQGTRFAGQLQSGLIEMVFVQVQVTDGMNDVTGFQATLLRDHVGQESRGSGVIRDA